MLSLLRRGTSSSDLLSSRLYSQDDFYPAFLKDLGKCGHEVIIESPFITSRRLDSLLPMLEKLRSRKVRIIVNTRDPEAQDDEYLRDEARQALSKLQHLGVHVLYTAGHHRKLAVLDRSILYGVRSISSRKTIAPRLCGEWNQHSSPGKWYGL